MNLVLDSEPLRLLLDGLTSPAPLRGSDRLRWNTLRQLAAEVARTGGAVVAPELALLELSRRPAAVAQLQARLRTRAVEELITIAPATRPVIYRAGLLLGGIGKSSASVVDAVVVATAYTLIGTATIATVDPGDLGLLASLAPGVTVQAL